MFDRIYCNVQFMIRVYLKMNTTLSLDLKPISQKLLKCDRRYSFAGDLLESTFWTPVQTMYWRRRKGRGYTRWTNEGRRSRTYKTNYSENMKKKNRRIWKRRIEEYEEEESKNMKKKNRRIWRRRIEEYEEEESKN